VKGNRKTATVAACLIGLSLVVAHGSNNHAKLGQTTKAVRLPSSAILDERAQPLLSSGGKVGFVSSVTGGSVIAFSLTSGNVLSTISVGETVGPVSMIERDGRRLLAIPALNKPQADYPATVTIVDATQSKAMEPKAVLVLPPKALITHATRALLSADGRFCFIASSFEEPTLFSFNVETGQLVSQLSLAGRPSEISLFDKGKRRMLAIASSVSNQLVIAGVTPNGELTIGAAYSPAHARFDDSNNPVFSADGGTVYIAAFEGDRLFRIDSDTGAELASTEVSAPRRVTVVRRDAADYLAVTQTRKSGSDERGGATVLSSDGSKFEVKSRFQPPDGVEFSSANNCVFTSSASTVFLSSSSGVVFAFNADTAEMESYSVVGSELRRMAVSERARAVAVVRSNPEGDQVVVINFDLTDEGEPDPNLPTIDSLNPGVVEQGRLHNLRLVVVGRNFTEGSSLLVNGIEIAADLIKSGRALETKLPKSMFVQPGVISVMVKSANGGLSPAKELAIVRPNAPVIAEIEPAEIAGPAGPFTLVVKGSNFRSSSTIVLGDQPLTTEHVGDQKLRATVPAEIARMVATRKVTVKDLAVSDLISANSIDLLIYGPRITSLHTSVDTVVAGDKRFQLRIIGTNFRPGAQVELRQSGQSVTASGVEVRSRKIIRLRVSSTLIQDSGTMQVVVKNIEGGVSEPAELAIHGPEIQGFEPGNVLAGESDLNVSIVGANFRKRARVYVGNEDQAFQVERSQVRFRNTGRIVVKLTGDLNNLLSTPGSLRFSVVNPNAGDGVPSDEKALSVVGPTISAAGEQPVDDPEIRRVVIDGENFRRGALIEFLVDGAVMRQQPPSRFSPTRVSVLIKKKKLDALGEYQVRVINPGNIASGSVRPTQNQHPADDE